MSRSRRRRWRKTAGRRALDPRLEQLAFDALPKAKRDELQAECAFDPQLAADVALHWPLSEAVRRRCYDAALERLTGSPRTVLLPRPVSGSSIPMDPRDRFTQTVDDYRRHRPAYPEALFDWIEAEASLHAGDTVVDVGCGTGISSRMLARRGWRVIGIDPNEAMLTAARAEGGGPVYFRTDAESLDIGDFTCDAIVGGQSFHWIDFSAARPAFRRRLKPTSEPDLRRVIGFWNVRRTSTGGFMKAYDDLLLAWSPEYQRVAIEHRLDAIRAETGAREASFDNEQALDREGLKGRVWSSSYVRNVVEDREGLDRELDEMFDAHARGGRVTLLYRTVALSFEP